MSNLHLITGHKGSAHISSQDIGVSNAVAINQGRSVFKNYGESFDAEVQDLNTVIIKDGFGIFDGRIFEIEKNSMVIVQIESGTYGKKRVDVINLRYNYDSETTYESLEFVVTKGDDYDSDPQPNYSGYQNRSILDGDKTVDFPFYLVYVYSYGIEVVRNFDFNSRNLGWRSDAFEHSTAIGRYTEAKGYNSFAEGDHTKANGTVTHAEGYYTTATGNYSHAQNQGTIAGYKNQTAIGQFNNNKSDNLFEIGNGLSDDVRTNAFEVTKTGNAKACEFINQDGKELGKAVFTVNGNAPDSSGNVDVSGGSGGQASSLLNDDDYSETTHSGKKAEVDGTKAKFVSDNGTTSSSVSESSVVEADKITVKRQAGQNGTKTTVYGSYDIKMTNDYGTYPFVTIDNSGNCASLSSGNRYVANKADSTGVSSTEDVYVANTDGTKKLSLLIAGTTTENMTSLDGSVLLPEGSPVSKGVELVNSNVNKVNESLTDYGLNNVFDGQLKQGYLDAQGKVESNTHWVVTNSYSVNAGDKITVKTDVAYTDRVIYLFNGSTVVYKDETLSRNVAKNEFSFTVPSGVNNVRITLGWYNQDNTVTPSTAGHIGIYINNEISELKNDLCANNAPAHNAIYRGKYLGNALTTEQKAQISSGTFNDLYIGDYWTIGGVNYRIASFDYWLNIGDTACTTHHVVIVPDTNLYNAKMNDSNTTVGAYVGSAMYTTNLSQAKTTINNAFGSGNILSVRRLFTNAVSNGKPSAGAWYDSTVDLMDECMVYGTRIFTPANDGTTIPYNYTTDYKQLRLFALAPQFICNRSWYWLNNVVSSSGFANVYSYGFADYNGASYSYGVRPCFAIKG